jgi:predicted nucleic acid-binding protein
LAKRYIPETGTQWTLTWIVSTANNTILVSDIASVEMYSLLARRGRENFLPQANITILQALVLLHMQQEYLVLTTHEMILAGARSLVNRYPLRTLDALHLAAALEARVIMAIPMTFVSADRNLLSAAASEGLLTDNPNLHP